MITDYKDLPDLRSTDPAALVKMHGESGEADQPFAQFLRRLSPDDDAWADVDWPAVALSVSLDAADIESILAEYPEPPCTEDDDDDDGDDDLAYPICDAGDICRTAFETDAGDVADEADAPLVEVMRWMHENDLHSNKQSISIMADRFNAERAARILIRRAQTPTA